jgi:hypothetical protein
MVSHSSPGICEAYQQSELSWWLHLLIFILGPITTCLTS